MLHKRAKHTVILFLIYTLKFSIPDYQLQMQGCYIFSSNQELKVYHYILYCMTHQIDRRAILCRSD
jgi:hypothetical protein